MLPSRTIRSCPDMILTGLTAAVRHVIPAVLDATASLDELIVIGHSAGGHLAVELALTDWRGLESQKIPWPASSG